MFLSPTPLKFFPLLLYHSFDSASSSTPIWLDGVNCYPTDSTLLSCDHNDIGSYNCDHGDVEGLRCTNEPGMYVQYYIILYHFCDIDQCKWYNYK